MRQEDIDETRDLELILSLARKNDFVARADVVELLHVSENKAYQLLRKLVKRGALIPVNKGRYAKYKLAGGQRISNA